MENFWPTCLSRFEQELSTQQFNTWIKPLYVEIEGNAVRLVAPNRFVMQWVKERFLKKIEQFAHELQLVNIKIDFVISDIDAKNNDEKSGTKVEINHNINLLESQLGKVTSLSKTVAKKNNDATQINSGLNSAFNFDNYVTGRANQLARAAAIQVAGNPGTA
jgi:chromosomal replication initiator protein